MLDTTTELTKAHVRISELSKDNRKTATLMLALNRDVLWLERELRSLVKATALSGDQMREHAAEVLEKAKKRRKRTMATKQT